MSGILLTGGSGLLGRELQKLDPEIYAPSSFILNVTDPHAEAIECDLIIHAAALTGPEECAANPRRAMLVNITGTVNLVRNYWNTRFVYLSTDYVFKGDRGLYKPEDELLPQNFYAWTKLGGESAVQGHPNHLIIRTSFCPDEFPYTHAFDDQYTSRDAVSTIAPIVLAHAKSKKTGVVHAGTRRKSVYELARKLGADPKPAKRKDYMPRDTSLI